MGVMMAVAIGGPFSGTPSTTTVPGAAVTPTTAAPSLSSTAAAAATATCLTDYQTVNGALDTYTSLYGFHPAAGTAWATSGAAGVTLIQSWPSDPGYFAITWNGNQLVVTPAHGAVSDGSPGTPSPPTGCYAA